MLCSVPLLFISAYDTPTFRENSPMDNSGFVKLLTVGDPNEAQITAARLRAAGIEVRLHGENFGPYPIPLGELADTEVWVPADRVDEATEVLTG